MSVADATTADATPGGRTRQVGMEHVGKKRLFSSAITGVQHQSDDVPTRSRQVVGISSRSVTAASASRGVSSRVVGGSPRRTVLYSEIVDSSRVAANKGKRSVLSVDVDMDGSGSKSTSSRKVQDSGPQRVIRNSQRSATSRRVAPYGASGSAPSTNSRNVVNAGETSKWRNDLYDGPAISQAKSHVFVRNLPENITEKDVSEFFAKAGDVVSVKVRSLGFRLRLNGVGHDPVSWMGWLLRLVIQRLSAYLRATKLVQWCLIADVGCSR
eukprot:GHVU01021576.1.p1 GENE.GHVU01021576.1~~GHVU01021576.1.p1  ORF type:complete len:269 (+),score=3.97 GHVU01021576.1:273-1079(+)